ncbi:MAG: type I-E CRISPR-associated endonuclease Cas1e [Sphaerobacter thermophilus]|uniref:type I-E CRISPR-associated endonuclease Cas1e n=1 Tax=Sphaerobacter thermophilus TaxID=2057 RepID=UPI000DB8728F|nr:MAG: type I-E CRISPR-associated endonuclease Cas1 [Sphaerobacter thermophilus]
MDLHILPKVRDSWSYLYVEHARIEQEAKAIAIHDAVGMVPVPCASLGILMLGPGTSISHAAIRALAENGCLVLWTGEEGVRFYAQGLGETRSARNLMRQARLWADPALRLRVVFRMYQMRFSEPLPPDLTLQQIRGMEGARVRDAYARASRETGVPWRGRSFQRRNWSATDPINRALSCANSCLYGICHAAIVSLGYSPGLGFIHTGKMLSFVYDIADLYKATVTIPLAFRVVAEGTHDLEGRVRRACRDAFVAHRLLGTIATDIEHVLDISDADGGADEPDFDEDAAYPGGLWDPSGAVAGGVNHAPEGGEEE